MTAEEVKAQKARSLIYKHPALASLGYETIIQELDEISSECDEVSYAMDISSVIDALDGEVTNVKIVRLKVRSFWIGRVGKLLWLTKEEAENFIKENLDWKNEIGYREED